MGQQDCIDLADAVLGEDLHSFAIESRPAVNEDCPDCLLNAVAKVSSDDSLERLIFERHLDDGRRGTAGIFTIRYNRLIDRAISAEKTTDVWTLLGRSRTKENAFYGCDVRHIGIYVEKRGLEQEQEQEQDKNGQSLASPAVVSALSDQLRLTWSAASDCTALLELAYIALCIALLCQDFSSVLRENRWWSGQRQLRTIVNDWISQDVDL